MHQALDRLGQIGHGGGGALAGAGLIDRLAQAIDGRAHLAGAAAGHDRLGGLVVNGGGEPVFQFGVETVLRLARLQVEEAEHQRAGETEQRGRERYAHAAERRGEALAQRVEHAAGIAAGFQPLDHAADRTHGFDQAPERAEQAEEHQQPGHVAQDIARLVEAGGDRVENAAHQLRRHRHAADAAAEDRRHRRQQHRRPLDREAGIGEAEIIDPGDFRIEADHLARRQHDADQQDPDDQRVEAGIGHERHFDLLVQQEGDQPAEHDEHQHPEQEDAGR